MDNEVLTKETVEALKAKMDEAGATPCKFPLYVYPAVMREVESYCGPAFIEEQNMQVAEV